MDCMMEMVIVRSGQWQDVQPTCCLGGYMSVFVLSEADQPAVFVRASCFRDIRTGHMFPLPLYQNLRLFYLFKSHQALTPLPQTAVGSSIHFCLHLQAHPTLVLLLRFSSSFQGAHQPSSSTAEW